MKKKKNLLNYRIKINEEVGHVKNYIDKKTHGKLSCEVFVSGQF